jgi:hypothetical protein
MNINTFSTYSTGQDISCQRMNYYHLTIPEKLIALPSSLAASMANNNKLLAIPCRRAYLATHTFVKYANFGCSG